MKLTSKVDFYNEKQIFNHPWAYFCVCLCSCSECNLKTCPVPTAHHCVSYCSPFAPRPPRPSPVSSLLLALTVLPPASCFPVLKLLVTYTVLASLPRSVRGRKRTNDWLLPPQGAMLGIKWQETPEGFFSAHLSEDLCFCQWRQFTYTSHIRPHPRAVLFTPHNRMSDLSETFPRYSERFLEFKQQDC